VLPIADRQAVCSSELNTRRNGEGRTLRVRATDGHMKIVEVIMAGASMGVTQRDEFASVIQRQGLDGLIGDLRGRVDDLQAEATRD